MLGKKQIDNSFTQLSTPSAAEIAKSLSTKSNKKGKQGKQGKHQIPNLL